MNNTLAPAPAGPPAEDTPGQVAAPSLIRPVPGFLIQGKTNPKTGIEMPAGPYELDPDRDLNLSRMVALSRLKPLKNIPHCGLQRISRGPGRFVTAFCVAPMNLRQAKLKLDQAGYLHADIYELCQLPIKYPETVRLPYDIFALGSLVVDDPRRKIFAAPFICGEVSAQQRKLDISLNDGETEPVSCGDWTTIMLLRLPD